jgi:C4-dicarboxylate-specific signal transduction histidine kinase
MNAHEAAPGTVSLDFSTDGDLIDIIISDRGSGFPEEQLASPFEPFKSTKSAGVGKGYGLGLAMANAIVQQAGGKLRLKNLAPGAEVRICTKVLV